MAPSESENPSTRTKTELDDLGDDELFQVLVRVPQKTARIIRAVARRWNSIICSPSYADQLCSNHPRSDDYALFLDQFNYQNLMLPSEADPAALEKCPIDLSYVSDGCDSHRISSTSEDLLLLSFQGDSFVCNPFTKESVRLPPPLISPPSVLSIVCETNRGHNNNNNNNIRYSVVHYQKGDAGISFRRVFVSETGRWKDVTSEPVIWKFSHQSVFYSLSFIRRKKFVCPVAYGGKLHWFNGEDCVVYDPFQDIFSVISGPQLEQHMDHFGFWLGVVHGSLTLAKFDYERGPVDLCYIIIWELDSELGQWILRNKSWFQKPDRPDTQHIDIGALHPSQDIAYFTMSGGIGLHDLSKGSDNFSKVLLPDDDALYEFFFSKSFLLARPWHPTSVCYHGSECSPLIDCSPDNPPTITSYLDPRYSLSFYQNHFID